MHGETVDLSDASLRALGIHRIEVPVPFLEAGGPANVYAIEDADGRYTLFDTGIGTSEGIIALRAGASAAGIDLRALSRIVISHGHLDHFGNAQLLSEESGARVFVHDHDREKVVGDARFAAMLRKHRAYFLSLGVPVETADQMQAAADKSPSKIRYVEPDRLQPIGEGATLDFKHFSAVVKHLPGHTPGLICLWAERQGVFFADDHVLARVSPNPVLDLSQGEGDTKFRALCRYLEGAKFVRDLKLKIILPKHKPTFKGHRALLDGLFGFYDKRQAKLLVKLSEGPASIYELLPTLFPRRDLPRMVLMLSEVLANVEVLEDAKKVRVVERGAVVRYAVA